MTAGALRHPHRAHPPDRHLRRRQVAYIAMELVEGDSLADLLRQATAYAGRVGIICSNPLRALAFAHEQGVVHRDQARQHPSCVQPARHAQQRATGGTEYPWCRCSPTLASPARSTRRTDGDNNMGRTVVRRPGAGTMRAAVGSTCRAISRWKRCSIAASPGACPRPASTTQILRPRLRAADHRRGDLSPALAAHGSRCSSAAWPNARDRYQTAAEMADTLAQATGRTFGARGRRQQ